MGEKTYSLQPYLAAGILQAGAKLLSVEVAGKKFSAGESSSRLQECDKGIRDLEMLLGCLGQYKMWCC